MADTAGNSRRRRYRFTQLGGLGRDFFVRGTAPQETFRINAAALGRVMLRGVGLGGWHRRGVCDCGVYEGIPPASSGPVDDGGNGRGHLQPSGLATSLDDDRSDAGGGGAIIERVEGCAGWRSRERRRDEVDLVAQCSAAVMALIFIMAVCFWLLVNDHSLVHSLERPNFDGAAEVAPVETSLVGRPLPRFVARVDQ